MNVGSVFQGQGHFNVSDCVAACLSNCSTASADEGVDVVGSWWTPAGWWWYVIVVVSSSTLLLVIIFIVLAACRSTQ